MCFTLWRLTRSLAAATLVTVFILPQNLVG